MLAAQALDAPAAPRPFRITDVLSRDEIVALHRRAYLPALAGLAFTWGLIAAAFALVAWWPSVLTVVVALVVLGGRQLALGLLAHDAFHGALLPDRRLNDWVGQWLCAAFIWSDLARGRRHHLPGSPRPREGGRRSGHAGAGLTRPQGDRCMVEIA